MTSASFHICESCNWAFVLLPLCLRTLTCLESSKDSHEHACAQNRLNGILSYLYGPFSDLKQLRKLSSQKHGLWSPNTSRTTNIVFWPDCNYSLTCVIHKMKFPINDFLVSGHKTIWWRSNVHLRSIEIMLWKFSLLILVRDIIYLSWFGTTNPNVSALQDVDMLCHPWRVRGLHYLWKTGMI